LLVWLAAAPLALAQRNAIDSLHQLIGRYPAQDTAKVDMLVELAYRYYQSRPDSTLYFAKTAHELSKKISYLRGEGKALNRIAVGHSVKGNLSLAMRYYHDAMDIAEQLKDEMAVSSALNNIGYILRLQKQYDESLNYTLSAFRLSEKNQNQRAMAVNLTNLGWLYELKGDYPTALRYAERSVQLADSVGDDYHVVIGMHVSGNVYLKQGNYAYALKIYENGYTIAERAQLRQQVAFHLLGQGKVYMATNIMPRAKAKLEQALAIAQEVKTPEIIMEVSELLVKLNRQDGNFAEAFKYDDIYHAAKDSVFDIERDRQINRLEFEYDSKQKQQALKALEKERELEANRNRIYQFFLLAAAGAAVFVSLYALQLYSGRKKLERAYAKLGQQQEILVANNREFNQQNEALLAQAEQLRDLNQMKNQTLSIISHDLRGPLSSLYGAIDVMDPDIINAAELAQIKADLSAQYASVNKALENLLEWSKDQFEGRTDAKQAVSVREVAEEIRGLYEPQAAAKKIALRNQVPANLNAHIEPNQLRLILRNLVNNAIKFTPEQGQVDLLAQAHSPTHAQVTVRDSGTGISPEQMQRLFDPRRAFSTKGTLNEQGTGLGLLLSKEFVEKNSGKIWAESPAGQGSSFHFTLPTVPMA
jgi:two-component system, sensor histidine kinase and response regulator